MSYLFDTNVISELRKSPARINPQVRDWAAELELESIFLSAVSVYEIELGIARKWRSHPDQASKLQAWFTDVVMPMFQGRVLAFDEKVAVVAARMNVPDPRPLADSFIAATALVNGLTVATRNAQDFAGLGVAVINPWEL